MKTLSKLQAYMANRKALLPLALVTLALSSITSMLPLIFIWLIIRELLTNQEITSYNQINSFGWWAVLTAVGGIILYFLALTLSHLAAFRVENNMRREAMKKILSFPLGFFDHNTSGRIRKIIDDNASVTHGFLAHQLPDLAGSIIMPVTALIVIIFFDWKLGIACLVPIIFSMLIMRFMLGKKGEHFMKSYMNALEEMNTEAVEYVRGIPVVKVFQQTVFSFKNFHRSIKNYKNMVHHYTLLWERPMSAYTVIIHAFAYFLIPVAILLINASNNTASIIINLIFFVLLTPIFAQSIMKSMYLNEAFSQASEAILRMEELTSYEPLLNPITPQSIKNHNIRFNKVSFSYPESSKKAINDISFNIPEGKTYALVGSSGSGKTTIARLVPRFWDADTGSICIGDTNVKNIALPNLMQSISFVFQNNKLFKSTLLDNICYGNPDATSKQVDKALELAQCRSLIEKLPNGLYTKIGTEGTYLPGGEQQRIALARAILKDAPIVILDEATAFSDPESEHLIQQALGELTKGKTVLMIAHRLSSVVDADRILVIDKGQIAEQGKHDELLMQNGIYANMWNEYQKSIQWTIGKEAQYV